MRLLGVGYTSEVYLGHQARLDRAVAVKVVDLPAESELAAGLFDNEGRLLGRLAPHPNILTAFESGTTGEGLHYLVTEYLPEGTLADRLRDDGPLPWAEVASIGVELSGALATAHANGIVHGDLRLHNLLVGRLGQPVLGDFGISAIATSEPAVAQVASPHAAPEVRAGGNPSALTDVYGLAACLHTLLGGQVQPGVAAGRSAEGEWPPLPDSAGPPQLLDLIATALETDPSRRPSSARALGEALRELQVANGQQATDMQILGDLGSDGIDGLRPDPTADDADPASRHATASATLPRRSTARLVGLAALVVAAAVSVGVLLGWDPNGDPSGDEATADTVLDGPGGAEDPVAGESGDSLSFSDDEALPRSDIQGVQSGVDYDVPGEDTSGELELKLSEESLVFHPLEGRAVVDSPYYGVPLEQFPAAFHFQAFNPDADGRTCTGMMTRELVAAGVWERGSRWPEGVLQVSVGEFGSADMAREMATALSLTSGVQSSQCRGMAGFGVEDHDDYGVLHRDTLKLLPPSDQYNHWSGTDVDVGDRIWPNTTRMVLQRGPYVVDVGLATVVPLRMGDDEAVAEIAEQVVSRL